MTTPTANTVADQAAAWFAEQAVIYLTSPQGRALLRDHAAEVEVIVAKMRAVHNIPPEVLHAPYTI